MSIFSSGSDAKLYRRTSRVNFVGRTGIPWIPSSLSVKTSTSLLHKFERRNFSFLETSSSDEKCGKIKLSCGFHLEGWVWDNRDNPGRQWAVCIHANELPLVAWVWSLKLAQIRKNSVSRPDLNFLLSVPSVSSMGSILCSSSLRGE